MMGPAIFQKCLKLSYVSIPDHRIKNQPVKVCLFDDRVTVRAQHVMSCE